jgi:hypothetical protein
MVPRASPSLKSYKPGTHTRQEKEKEGKGLMMAFCFLFFLGFCTCRVPPGGTGR